jgi:predicted ATPase
VSEACADTVDELIEMCTGLHVVATSREPLRVTGETHLQIEPLAVPDAQTDLDELHNFDSVQLFCDRVALRQPDFSLTTENAASARRVGGVVR